MTTVNIRIVQNEKDEEKNSDVHMFWMDVY